MSLLGLLALLAGCEDHSASTQPVAKDAGIGVYHISEAALASHIKILASDEFGGRAPGSPGEQLTVDYLVSVFKEAGLEPANGDSYTQAVPLISVEVLNKPALTFTGGINADLKLDYAKDQVLWTRRQTSTASIDASELVFVGYGINAPERGWNDYADIDVKGKTVLMLINDPGYATQDPAVFNGNAMTYYGRWTYKYEEAARQGAIGAIIIHDSKPAAYPWPTVQSSWSGPQFDRVREDKGEKLAAIEAWITTDKAQTLFEKAGFNLADVYKQAQSVNFQAFPMHIQASAAVENRLVQVDSQNVVAMIKGSESPEDVFIYMAHWDHIGTDTSIEGDGIYNGALDNASGTGGLLELARAYASLPQAPKRSVAFIAVTAEEQGLLGSAFYAANPLFPLANTIGGLNMDGLNAFGRTKDIMVVGSGMSELEDFLEARTVEQNRVVKADAQPQKGYFYRSDHFELSKLGVPMIYPNSGQDHLEKGIAYGQQMSADYLANSYHGPSDEYDDSWVLDGAVEDLQLYFLTGSDIIESGSWPQWREGSEFKALRDAQRPQ